MFRHILLVFRLTRDAHEGSLKVFKSSIYRVMPPFKGLYLYNIKEQI